ncbi:MAG: AhpC/TSA family protein [Acidobacteriota bacterium]|nr:AhpC/TSA family protein [Acidobacteriota bacterium]
MKWRSLEESPTGVDDRPLREQFAERKELIAKYLPAETQATHTRAIRELEASGISDRALRLGEKAPPFELQAHDGSAFSSQSVLERERLVVCFFRGRWCPFCVGQLEAMNAVLSQIRETGASLVAISPQTVKQSFFMADQHKFKFPLLSDAGNKAARSFGITYRVSEDQQAVYRKAMINLPFVNGDESWELPIPATYILDHDRTVLYTSSNPDYTQRPEPSAILEILRNL